MSKVINANELKAVDNKAEKQGLKILKTLTDNDELDELAKLTDEIERVADNSDELIEDLKSIQSPSLENISFRDMAKAAEAAQGTINLFDEYIVNVTKKSYEKLKKIRENKESTSLDFFKGCLEFAADMFFALKNFYKKVKEEYPVITVAELALAPYIAPVYAAVGLVSGAISACGYKDKTAELIEGGKELREEAKKAVEAKKEAEKEIEGEKIENVSKSCRTLNGSSVLSGVTMLAKSVKAAIDIAAELENSGVNKETITGYIKKVSEVASNVPKTKEEIPAFVGKLIPDLAQLSEKEKGVVNIFQKKLNELKENVPTAERITSVANASVKLYEGLARLNSKIPEPLKEFMGKTLEAKIPKGFESLSKAAGFGFAFAEVVANIGKAVATPEKQRA